MPTTAAGVSAECGWIRQEMARQRGIYGSLGALGLNSQNQAIARTGIQGNMASLETRAANVGCPAAFREGAAANAGTGFDECYNKCKQLTTRTNDQCFDACKR